MASAQALDEYLDEVGNGTIVVVLRNGVREASSHEISDNREAKSEQLLERWAQSIEHAVHLSLVVC